MIWLIIMKTNTSEIINGFPMIHIVYYIFDIQLFVHMRYIYIKIKYLLNIYVNTQIFIPFLSLCPCSLIFSTCLFKKVVFLDKSGIS